MAADEHARFFDALRRSAAPRFPLEVSTPFWVLPNRAGFVNWVDRVFRSDKTRPSAVTDLFPHQKFVKDYLQWSSPYRGLLLYHSLGSGKSRASVAAVELLREHMTKVYVLVPGSLKRNYADEVRKAGRYYYDPDLHWELAAIPDPKSRPDLLAKYARALGVHVEVVSKVVAKHGGVWVADPDLPPNFGALTERQRGAVLSQIDAVMMERYHFVSYNGISTRNLVKMTRNMFDDSCVVIDEAHDFIGYVAGGGSKVRSVPYQLLMEARNCKILMLSGTPVVNDPVELAYVVNLLTGYRVRHELTLRLDDGALPVDGVSEVVTASGHVDGFRLDLNTRTLYLDLVPENFRVSASAKQRAMTRLPEPLSHDSMIQDIGARLKARFGLVVDSVSRKRYKTLPDDHQEFHRVFVDELNGKVVNADLLTKRILGTTSVYSNVDPARIPTRRDHVVHVELSDHQFKRYAAQRAREQLLDAKFRGRTKTVSVHRFYTRAVSNFAFPDGVRRPATSIKSNGEDHGSDDGSVDLALDALESGGYLSPDNLPTFGPKMDAVARAVEASPGPVLVYSQFKTVEGVGVFRRVLRRRGFAEIKVLARPGGGWALDESQATGGSDASKPKFAVYDTSEPGVTDVVMRVFNSELDQLPPAGPLAAQMTALAPPDRNAHGALIKVLLITASGSQGISLKNVRQVHLLEPYWNQVRLDQVRGRAIRTDSHAALPVAERTVDTYLYLSTFSAAQTKTREYRALRETATTDQAIHDLASKKARINQGVLDLLVRASVDCGLGLARSPRACFSFPVDVPPDAVVSDADVHKDMTDDQYRKGVKATVLSGRVFRSAAGTFFVDTSSASAYSDIYRLYNSEFGEWGGVRFCSSQLCPSWTGIAQVNGTPGSSGSLATNTYYVQVTGSDTQNQFESQIYQVSGSVAVVGPNGSISVTLPATAGYTYSVYIGTTTSPGNLALSPQGPLSGTMQGQATQLSGGQVVTLTGTGVVDVPPAAPATGLTVYPVFIFGRGAYGQVVLDNIKITLLTQADKSDPLNQLRVVGWKSFWGTIILNQAFFMRIECTSNFSAAFS